MNMMATRPRPRPIDDNDNDNDNNYAYPTTPATVVSTPETAAVVVTPASVSTTTRRRTGYLIFNDIILNKASKSSIILSQEQLGEATRLNTIPKLFIVNRYSTALIITVYCHYNLNIFDPSKPPSSFGLFPIPPSPIENLDLDIVINTITVEPKATLFAPVVDSLARWQALNADKLSLSVTTADNVGLTEAENRIKIYIVI